MPIVKLDGTDLYYEEAGSGRDLILIPGFASGAWSWNWQLPDLALSFRVVTFDPRGVSRSKVHDGSDVSIERIADDVAGLMDALRIGSASILGISFGGFVAQEFAIRHGSKVDKLVLAFTSFGGTNHVMPAAETLASFSSIQGLNSAERIRKNLVSAFSAEFCLSSPGDVDRFCSLREQNPLSDEVYRRQLGSAMSFDAEDKLMCVTAETLVIGGNRDTVVPFQNSVNLADRLPNAGLKVIQNGGHMAFIEQAGEFNRIVTEFLTGH